MKMRFDRKLGRLIRQKFRNSVLSRHGKAVLAETWNGKFLVEAGDFSVGRKLLSEGEYDRGDIEWLLEQTAPCRRAVVVGAHIGALLIPLAKRFETVFGYEPNELNYWLLTQNLLLNEVVNAVVKKAAVGDRSGTATLHRNTINTGNTGIATRSDPKGEQVPLVKLDEEFPAGEVDLVIMDVEGHETQAVAGATKLIARTRALYIEFAPEQLQEHGNDPSSFLRSLCAEFPVMRIRSEPTFPKSSVAAAAEVEKSMHRKSYLTNILFSR